MMLVLLSILALTSSVLTDANRQPRHFYSSPYYPLYHQSYFSTSLPNDADDFLDDKSYDTRLSWNGLLDDAEEVTELLPRQNLFGLSNINSAINPIANFFGRLPNNFIRNPDSFSLTNSFAACKDAAGLDGVCVPSLACIRYGGRPSSSCGLGTVCCVNSISKCGGQVTLNNTYWRSPPVISSGSTCGLTLTLDNNLIEQKKKICQIRLDFVSFTIDQPNAETVCATDSFQVVGATNQVPIICGDNPSQHMYLTPASSVTDLQLLFTFGQSTITRSWNMKISLLPCLASYLAPKDCLQYLTDSSGTIKSFNWRDIESTATRQLANQNFKICFRSELVANMAATRICYTQCAVTNGGLAFSLSTAAAAAQSQDKYVSCNNDFLIIPGGFDPAMPLTTATNAWDRYCGRALNPVAASAATTVCSNVKGFSVTYRTNGDETTTPTVDTVNTGNIGFCLDYQQRTA